MYKTEVDGKLNLACARIRDRQSHCCEKEMPKVLEREREREQTHRQIVPSPVEFMFIKMHGVQFFDAHTGWQTLEA